MYPHWIVAFEVFIKKSFNTNGLKALCFFPNMAHVSVLGIWGHLKVTRDMLDSESYLS